MSSHTNSAMSACIACGSAAANRHLYDVAGHAILACSVCGLGKTVVRPNFDPSAIYNETYFQGGQDDGYADYKGSSEYLSLEFRHVLQEMAEQGVSCGKLFEFGCAYGFFLDEARKNFEVAGAELAEDAVLECRRRELDVVRHVDDAFLQQRGPFDAVVMLDVIEHLTEPKAVLETIHKHMAPGAMLTLSTGDFGALSARLMRSHWRLMTPPQHLWFFTVDSMTRLLRAQGFKIVRVSHPAKRVPLSLILYQLARYLGAQKWLRGRQIPGSVPMNLFDAMRVFAIKVPD